MGRKQRQAAKARRARRRVARTKRELELLEAKTMCHILGLPFELLSMIARRVLLSSEAGRDTQSLCCLIQTCKKFEVGLPILYRQLDGRNVMRGGWWWTYGIGRKPFETAERICRSILSAVQHSRGGLFRFADFHALAGLDLAENPNRVDLIWPPGRDARVSATVKELLALLGVTINPSRRLSSRLTGDPIGYRWFDVQTLITLLGLSVMPKLVKLRLPIHETSLRLSEIPNRPRDYPVHVRASWGTKIHNLEFHQKNFPSFSELRELDLVYNDYRDWVEYDNQRLDVDNFSWIMRAALKLRTLRLANFNEFRGRNGLDFHSSLPPCDNITTRSLIECGISFERCQELLSCFPQPERFKMTRSKPTPIYDDVGYTRRERASLMLKALAAAAPGLEKIFLGDCVQPRKPKENSTETEKEIAILPTNRFSGLKTLGLTHGNLFQLKDSMEKADILVNIVRGCPTLETLEIFDALHESNRPVRLTLRDALQALAKDLAARSKTSHLKEIRLWYFDKVYLETHLGDQDNWFCYRQEANAAREEPSPSLASDGSGDILLPISDYSGRWAERNQRLREREISDMIEVFRSRGW